MLIKSPLKKEKVKQNKRRSSSKDKKRSTIKGAARSKGNHYGRRKQPGNQDSGFSFPKLKPWKVIVGALAIGALGILYLNHVFATQQLLQEVQQLEREYNQVKRMHEDYRLTYDRMIGPADIYENAKDAGFINGGPAEKVIEVEK
ncbi:hypothetical protein [Fodinibius halophilus]|uniref:Septum formation initiator family protein n=1 Tax=Fodinibius halophilus TaxID=1736908 RepID=A0A6M1T7N4_9BACT|nr:hypothetical protein [Fodinibius halophilus]NGP89415.1 hypothetical protein [Fodinibius halophilus]